MNKMEAALDYLIKLWPVAVGFVGIVAWLVRVDGRTNANSNEIARVERRIGEQRKEDMSRLDQSLATISQDIKELLGRK